MKQICPICKQPVSAPKSNQGSLIAPESISFTIRGNVPAKSNSRRLVTIPGKGGKMVPRSIASKEFDAWEKAAILQVPTEYKQRPFGSNIAFASTVYFRDQRSDLDNSAKGILDMLQKPSVRVILNDNRVQCLFMWKAIDATNPRSEITITEIL